MNPNTPIHASTIAFAAKRAILARLTDSADGGLLQGWAPSYAYNAGAGPKAIYGGGWRSLQQIDQVPEEPGLVVLDIVEVSFYCQITDGAGTLVEDLDAELETMGANMVSLFANNRALGPMQWMSISRGQGDWNDTTSPDTTNGEVMARAAYAMQVQGFLTWRSS